MRKTLRMILADHYNIVTVAQQGRFNQMYPGGVNGIEQKKIKHAISQCESTHKSNIEKINTTFIRIK